MIDQRGIGANPDKVKPVLRMKSSVIVNKAQGLTTCIAAWKIYVKIDG